MSSEKTTEGRTAAATDVREQRRHIRTQKYGAQEISIRRNDAASETLTANLWDFSYGGVGIELPKPLTVGEEIELTADLLSPDYSMHVEGTGRVVHCRPVGRDLYRVGVAFLSIAYHRIEPDE